ncbi:MAG: hypothetical protein IPH93_03130 [Saprospiraceae bacterium]|nr:hypothetical protein [Saprospiraceae bacterium]MBK7812020.1 hypothetical protein [Saprospiraceae bacterium]MBK9632774.1 hypothetical protein [Saprospiraceae bacterium]
MTVKEKILREIHVMDNEELLNDVYTLILDLKGLNEILVLNDEQEVLVRKAQEEYRVGETHKHEDLFKNLLG